MKVQKHILIDVDGVLCGWAQAVCRSTGVDILDVDDYDIFKCIKRIRGKEAADSARELAGRADFIRGLPVLPWAHELVRAVPKSWKATLVTQPTTGTPDDEAWLAARSAWIETHFPGLDFCFTSDSAERASISADLLVDDSADNCRLWRDRWRRQGGRCVCPAYAYNEHAGELEGCLRDSGEVMPRVVRELAR